MNCFHPINKTQQWMHWTKIFITNSNIFHFNKISPKGMLNQLPKRLQCQMLLAKLPIMVTIDCQQQFKCSKFNSFLINSLISSQLIPLIPLVCDLYEQSIPYFSTLLQYLDPLPLQFIVTNPSSFQNQIKIEILHF